MDELSRRDRILASSRRSKHLCFRFVPTSFVMNEATKLYFFDDFFDFACLQSSLHTVWAYWTCGTMGMTTIKYSTSEALETWPMPIVTERDELDHLGDRYHKLRDELMADDSIGMTQVYNRFHDPSDSDSRVEAIRKLHQEIDLAVTRAYGWDDLDLEHGFHAVPYLPENDGIRFTISDRARLEVLRRLSELNHQRYEEEVSQGLHRSSGTRAPRRAAGTALAQPSLDFEPRVAATVNDATPSSAILSFLGAQDGWHAKADVLAATGITDAQWNTSIAELIADGKVDRQGERRGARYRAAVGGGAAQ